MFNHSHKKRKLSVSYDYGLTDPVLKLILERVSNISNNNGSNST